jgi:outer membrane receptor protein involved in Fe transport
MALNPWIASGARGAAVWTLVVLAAQPALAQAPATAPEPPAAEPTRLPPVVVRGREDSLVGVADTGSEGSVGAEQIEERPIARPGEVLETVPGVILTQHSGAGKANQFFLRGFNLDHGTDFATSIDGVPVNLPSHGHGQGYSDLNPVIPELVERVDYWKGPYYAEQGDFSSAGAANLVYFRSLPRSLAQLEGGMFEYGRALFAASPRVGEGTLLGAVELFHDNGPWEHPDHYRKMNLFLRYSLGDAERGASITASAYKGKWDATDQIAERAVDEPGFGRFDSLDDNDGGDSQKYMLHGEWHRSDAGSATRLLAYGFYQDLDLFSNFTYLLSSPQGDQFEQTDRRWVGGGAARHTWYGRLGAREMENSVGLQLRSDSIQNGLFQTVRRHRTPKPDYAGGTLPATTRRDEIWELSLAPYVENRIQWFEKLRTVVGARADWFHFDVDADQPGGSGTDDDVLVSPKASLVLGPWADTEFYLSGGLGFHSNDARGVTASVDPADALVQTQGAEVGVRSAWLPGLHSTLAFWWLDIDSELLFVGDAGVTEASRPSRRYGIEIANYYNPTEWLTLDLDWSLSHARFRDDDPAGDYIPGSIESVVAAGATVHDLGGFFGSLRLRYFGPRALVEDDSVRSDDTVLLSARVGYQFDETWTLCAEVFNLLNRDDSEIDYYYPSRLPGEPAGPDEGGTNDIHFHPVAPISFRIALTARF